MAVVRTLGFIFSEGTEARPLIDRFSPDQYVAVRSCINSWILN
jgi:hypothetical protein